MGNQLVLQLLSSKLNLSSLLGLSIRNSIRGDEENLSSAWRLEGIDCGCTRTYLQLGLMSEKTVYFRLSMQHIV